MKIEKIISLWILVFICYVPTACAQNAEKWISFDPDKKSDNARHIVLVSGDEEYRSEEALPMLAKILSKHHGFKTTVLFAIDPNSGKIDPTIQTNIPGLQLLESADLMVIFTRFRQLPDEQMKYIDDYIRSGKPIIGMRTATHAFNYKDNAESPYMKYHYRSKIDGWEGGFGRQILGETWVNHHGDHGKEGTRGLINGIMIRQGHPILKGVNNIWVPTDVYGTNGIEGDSEILIWGLPTNGMTAESSLNLEKSLMPVAWTKNYTTDSGNIGRVFNTTMGSSVDLQNEDLRRLLVNASYWALGMEEQIPEKSKVDIIGKFKPNMFGFGDFKKGLNPSHYK